MGIEHLVGLLERAYPDLTSEEIADILWLTLQQWQLNRDESAQDRPIPSLPEQFEGNEQPFIRGPSAPLTLAGTIPESVVQSRPIAGLTTSRSSSSASTSGSTAEEKFAPGAALAVPDAPALRSSLEILKAFRPLMRQVPSAHAQYLDVPATVRAIAETEVWQPQMRPVLEPWLELALVVDTAPSMVIWQRTILDLRRILSQSGVFRDVRLWSLEERADSTVLAPSLCIRPGFGPKTSLQSPCRPQELLDPQRRRLILLITDGIHKRWDSSQIREILRVWAENGPLVMLQVLPEWLWERTALADVTKGQLFAQTSEREEAHPSQSLIFARQGRGRKKASAGTKVPVMTLEPAVVKRCSQVVAGQSSSSAPGLLFAPGQLARLSVDSKLPSDSPPPEPELLPTERLEQFRNFSSPMARRLVGLLAACPEINLPIIRLVQAAMLPLSQQVHVAEVLFGGLFKPQTDLTAHTPADEVEYTFHDGVRPLIQDTVPPAYAFQALSTWLTHRFGYSIDEFRVEVTDERVSQVKPFAGLLLDVLRRRGGDYAEIFEGFERVYGPKYATFAELLERENPQQDYEIRARAGTSGIAVLAIHGGNLQPGTSELAEVIAGEDHAFYTFVSLKPEIDQTLYVSSVQFDEPRALEIVGAADSVLSIHGCQGAAEFVQLGGLDEDWKQRVQLALLDAGFAVFDQEMSGIHAREICNRGRLGRGLRIEVSRGLRDRIFNPERRVQDAEGLEQFVYCLRQSTLSVWFDRAVEAPQSAIGQESNLPGDFQPLEIETAQLVDTATFPTLQEEEFTVATLVPKPQSSTPESSGLEFFEFETATLIQNPSAWRKRGGGGSSTWEIQRRQSRAECMVERLPGQVPLEMVLVPGGSFWMGSPEDEPERQSNEGPQHKVTVSPFLLGRYPVTQAQWKAVAELPLIHQELASDPSRFKGKDRPVENVSWHDAVEFCQRLSQYSGRSYRLPSEAEWEYACREFTITPFHFGETLSPELANYRGDSSYCDGPTGENRRKTTPVGSYPANAFGLCDMHGNVWEWCQDHYHDSYEGAPTDGSAWVDENPERGLCIQRGGSWVNGPRDCRSAQRFRFAPGNRDDDLGFRVVCAAPRT